MQKIGQRWLLPAKCVVWRVQRSPSCIKFSKTLTTGVGVGVAGGGAGRGGGDVTIKMLLSLLHHTWRQGEVRPITRHMTRAGASLGSQQLHNQGMIKLILGIEMTLSWR